jgi:hypothetical protein
VACPSCGRPLNAPASRTEPTKTSPAAEDDPHNGADQNKPTALPLNATPLEAWGCLLPLAVVAVLIVAAALIEKARG